MNKLFIGGFPLEISELELAKLVAPYGDIDTLKLVRDRQTHLCKGYAFVEMCSEEGLKNVIEALDGIPLGDRNLTVNRVAEKVEAPKPKPFMATGRPLATRRNDKAQNAARPRRPRRVS